MNSHHNIAFRKAKTQEYYDNYDRIFNKSKHKKDVKRTTKKSKERD